MNELFGTIATILAVTGVLLNNRKLISCFYIWFISNIISAYLHFDTQLYSLFARDVIFMFLAAEGLRLWSRKEGDK